MACEFIQSLLHKRQISLSSFFLCQKPYTVHKGPSSDPCGIADVTGFQIDSFPYTITCWILSFKQLSIHAMISSLFHMPVVLLWGISEVQYLKPLHSPFMNSLLGILYLSLLTLCVAQLETGVLRICLIWSHTFCCWRDHLSSSVMSTIMRLTMHLNNTEREVTGL